MSNPAHVMSFRLAHRLPLARLLLAGVLLAVLLAPASADAHSLFGDHDPNRPLSDYLTLGFQHMVGGWDHLLFIGGVVLLAGHLRTAAKLISAFVAGHSLTLLVATIAGWKLNATLVDVVIALSLVYVGAQGIRGRPVSLRVLGAVVFAFGLMHGLGLSTRLQDLGLPEDGVAVRVILFNVGVEVGQLAALAVIVGVGRFLARGLSSREQAARYTFAAIALSGLTAAAVMSFAGAQTDAGEKQVLAADGVATACTQQAAQAPQAPLTGDHPSKQFYGPDEPAPTADLAHVVGDGLVIVRYRPDLAPADLKQLGGFVKHPTSKYVIGAPDPSQTEPVRVVVAQRTMTCTKVDIAGLTTFRDDWLASLGERQRSQRPRG